MRGHVDFGLEGRFTQALLNMGDGSKTRTGLREATSRTPKV
jgi:hypothetical protein